MTRKYIQMGLYSAFLDRTDGSTRARRYANHISERKFDYKKEPNGKKLIPRTDLKTAQSMAKPEAAEIFRECLERVKVDKEYLRLRERHRQMYESQPLPEDMSQFEEVVDIKSPVLALITLEDVYNLE